MAPTDMEIAGCGPDGAVPQQELNGAWIDPGIEQMGGKGVPQGMNATAMVDARLASGLVVNMLGRATGHVALGVFAGKSQGR